MAALARAVAAGEMSPATSSPAKRPQCVCGLRTSADSNVSPTASRAADRTSPSTANPLREKKYGSGRDGRRYATPNA